VEPALGRAIDFLVGEKLAAWVELSNRTGLQLTAAGAKAAQVLLNNDTAMEKERRSSEPWQGRDGVVRDRAVEFKEGPLMLRIRFLRLRAITAKQNFGADLQFSAGLNVLRAGNTSAR